MDELLEIIERCESGPPPVRGILHHRSVPRGQTFREWDTKGRLWLWVATSLIEEAPRVDTVPAFTTVLQAAFVGTDVYDLNDEDEV